MVSPVSVFSPGPVRCPSTRGGLPRGWWGLVAIALGDGAQGGAVEPYGGHVETAFLGQVGQVSGGERWECRGAPDLGPGLEGAPLGGVRGPVVLGDAGV